MLKNIEINLITPLKNYRTIDDDPAAFKDLTQSVQKDGILQAMLVRESKKKPGTYELIFGNRRFAAAKEAGLTEVPCTIKDVKDEDILEFQVKENLQRKDVHPMDEAAAFLAYQKQKEGDIKLLASVFVKPERYIAHRLALNNLSPDIQKDFLKGFMNVSQAEVFAKLSPDHQKLLKQHARADWGDMKGYYTKRVADLQKFIEQSIFRTLSAAPFKKDDTSLNPKMGACNGCPKNTANAGVLFAEMSGQGRCMDSGCFAIKLNTHLVNLVSEVVVENPEIVLLKQRYDDKVIKEIAQIAKDHNLKILEVGEDCFTGNTGGKKLKGVVVNGNEIGKTVDVYLRASSSKKETGKKESTAEQISKIKEREERAKEIDLKKIHTVMLEKVREKKELLTPGMKHQPIDRAIMVYLLIFQTAEYSAREIIFKALKINDIPWGKRGYNKPLFEKLVKLTDDELAFVIRVISLKKFGYKNMSMEIHTEDTIMRYMAEYSKIDVVAIEKSQQEVAAKRIERVNKRIAELQPKQKPATAKKAAPKKAVKKHAAKKSARKVPVKKQSKK